MPYKTGKLKGQLTSAELRKLVKAHNKLFNIKIPTGATQPQIIKIINDNGYVVNHQKAQLQLRFKNIPKKITMDDVPKKKQLTELEKQKKEEKKQEKIDKEKKKVRAIKKEAIADEKARQKKKEVKKPVVKKPEIKKEVKKPEVKKPEVKKPEVKKPIRRQLGQTKKPDATVVRKEKPKPVRKTIGDVKKVGGTSVQDNPPKTKIRMENTEKIFVNRLGKAFNRPKRTKLTSADQLIDLINELLGDRYQNTTKTQEAKIEKMYNIPAKYWVDGKIGLAPMDGNTYDALLELQITTRIRDENNKLQDLDVSILPYKPDKNSDITVRFKKKDDKKKVKDKVKPSEAKFKLPSQTPKPVVIAKEKKPPKIDKSYKIVKINKSTYPLDVNQYSDIRDIPTKDIWDNLVTKRSNIFYPWSSIKLFSDIMYFYIIKDNKIKCIPPVVSKMCEYIGQVNELDKYGKKISKEVEVSGKKKKEDVKSSAWICRPNEFIMKYAEQYAKRYLECKKKNEPVAIPISKSGSRDRTETHANMLILNPYLNTAEHFEPHGDEYGGEWLKDKKTGKSKKFVPEQSSLKTGIDAINRELKRLGSKEKLKYIPMKDVCPKDPEAFLNGLQSGDVYRDKEPTLFEGVIITEIGGYCKMWSLFFMDTRMKTLQRPASEVMKEMMKMANDTITFLDPEKGDSYFDNKVTRETYVELIRGMSKYAWEQLQEVLKQPYNTAGITRDDLIKYIDKSEQLSMDTRLGVRTAIENLTVKLISDITKGEVFEDKPIDKDAKLGRIVKREEKPISNKMLKELRDIMFKFLQDIKPNAQSSVYKRYNDLYLFVNENENMSDKPVKTITKRKAIADALKFIKKYYKDKDELNDDLKNSLRQLMMIFDF